MKFNIFCICLNLTIVYLFVKRPILSLIHHQFFLPWNIHSHSALYAYFSCWPVTQKAADSRPSLIPWNLTVLQLFLPIFKISSTTTLPQSFLHCLLGHNSRIPCISNLFWTFCFPVTKPCFLFRPCLIPALPDFSYSTKWSLLSSNTSCAIWTKKKMV